MTNDLQQARIEAAMRACVLSPEIPTGQRAHLVHLEGVLTIREQVDLEVVVEKVLAAADAHLPTVEQIAEVLYDEFVTRTDLSMVECERTACAVRSLFGEVAGDE